MKKIYKYNTRKELLDYISGKVITFFNNNIRHGDINPKCLDQELCNKLFNVNMNYLAWIPYKYQTREMLDEVKSNIDNTSVEIISLISPSLLTINDCIDIIKGLGYYKRIILIPYKYQDKLDISIPKLFSIKNDLQFYLTYYNCRDDIIFNDKYDIEKVIEYLSINDGYRYIRFYDRIE